MFYMTIDGTRHAVTIEDGVKSYDPPLSESQQEKYASRCAVMLEEQTPPGHRSDTQFHSGRGSLLNQLQGDEKWAKHLAQQAQNRGYSVGANDVYIGQLDDAKGGNPDAFFKAGEGQGELKRRLQKSGKGCDMPGLYVEATFTGPKKKALNEKVLNGYMRQYAKTSEGAGKSIQELKSYVETKHGRPNA
jgi:hypothetical protein